MNRFQWERAVTSERGPANPTTRHVLLTLATHADKELRAWPTINLQAKETGLSDRAVRTHLEIAEQEGWLTRTYVGGGQAWRNYVYQLTTPKPLAERAERGAAASTRKGVERGAAANDSTGTATGIVAEGAAPDAQGAERHAEGAAPDDINVRHQVPTNMECSSTSKTIKEVKIEGAPFCNSQNPDPQHAKPQSRHMQGVMALQAMIDDIDHRNVKPVLQEKSPTEKAVELGLHQRDGEGPIAYVQRINAAWEQRENV